MNFLKPKLAILGAALVAGVGIGGVAHAAQLTLSGANVIGSASTLNDAVPTRFPAAAIFDQQSGNVLDVTGTPSNFWLTDGFQPVRSGNAWITVDLGASYNLTSFDLFNTHNDNFFDRGTLGFSILGANALVAVPANGLEPAGFDLAGTITTLASGSLTNVAPGANGPITAQSFASLNTAVRYIQFRPLSLQQGDLGAGLNELRVFGDPAVVNPGVPEPATWAMMIAGFGLVGGAMRRRQKVTVSYT